MPRRGALPGEGPEAPAASIMVAPWPQADERWLDPASEAAFAQVQEIVRAIRDIRKKMGLADRTPRLRVTLSIADPATQVGLEAARGLICDQAALDRLELGVSLPKPPASAAAVLPGMEAYVALEGVIDLDAERKRLADQLAKARKFLEGSERKLANLAFLEKAPKEVVEKEYANNAKLREDIQRLEANLAELE
jgi:valyl-tRNA synthetase